MSANHHNRFSKLDFGKKGHVQIRRQQTLDDEERVLPRRNADHILDPTQVKPRSLDALRAYEQLQELKLVEDDPLFS